MLLTPTGSPSQDTLVISSDKVKIILTMAIILESVRMQVLLLVFPSLHYEAQRGLIRTKAMTDTDTQKGNFSTDIRHVSEPSIPQWQGGMWSHPVPLKLRHRDSWK